MPAQPDTPLAATGTFHADLRGVHYDLLKDRVPAWFRQAPLQRQAELASYELHLPSWYRKATPVQKSALAKAHANYRETMNQLENRLATINDIFDFAEPLLKDEIKARFALELDVRNVYFARKYVFKGRDDLFGFFVFDRSADDTLNHEYRGTSLLEAALANFEPSEEKPLRCNDCQLITGWGSYDGDIIADWSTVKRYAKPIAPHDFARLCRGLDLGKRYQQHLKDILQPSDTTARQALEQQIEEHQRQHLAVTVEIAHQQLSLKPGTRQVDCGISASVYAMLKQLLAGAPSITLDNRPVQVQALSVFDIELVGPLLIGPRRIQAGKAQRLAVYLPNDPQQPLREYASGLAFMEDLRSRLHSAAYRRFFSRFVPLRQQGEFFRKFNNLYQPSGTGAQADYALVAKPAQLPIGDRRLEGNLWTQRRQAMVEKVYADARAVAVPTEDEDRNEREERLQSYFDAVVSVFNLAAFVVPGLGPIMLAVGAIQMCHEAYEGLEAFENGETREMWAHFSSIAMNVVLLGAGAKVLPHVQLSSTVDNLQPVTLPGGEQKLWKPDLAPYQTTLRPLADARPDTLGLFNVDGHSVLPLEGEHYRVQQDPVSGDYQVQHPTRADAYTPRLEHNDDGAWRHEGEEPLNWDGPTLLHRLGHRSQTLGAQARQQALMASGIDADTLRAVHVDQQPTPLLLADTLQRFQIHRELTTFIEQLNSPDRAVYAKADLALQMDLMQRRGLLGDAPLLNVLDSHGQVLWENPVAPASARQSVVLYPEQLARGEQLQQVLYTLQGTDPELKELPGTPQDSLVERATLLRQYLAEQAEALKGLLLEERYKAHTRSTDADVNRLLNHYPKLSTRVARLLLDGADEGDVNNLRSGARLSEALDEQARWAEQETRASRAYEGLFLDTLQSLDSQRLALRSLELLPGWQRGTRIELRLYSPQGNLEDAIGSPDAQTTRQLVINENGDFDSPGGTDFYSATWALLRPEERQAMGIRTVSELRHAVLREPLPREPLRTVLLEHPVRRPEYDPSMRLLGGGRGIRQLLASGANALRTPQARVSRLYPNFEERDINALIESLGTDVRGGLSRLEQEYSTLKQTLKAWVQANHPTDESARARLKEHARQIKRSWRRQIGNTLDVRFDQPVDLPALTADFSHVQELRLAKAQWSETAETFLAQFPGLKRLHLSNSSLDHLPDAVGQMPGLTHLMLAGNRIRLDAPAVARLQGLTNMLNLNLSRNPLGMPPDVSGMPKLRYLELAYSGLEQWPAGLLEQGDLQRLDLSHNQLREIPRDNLHPPAEHLEKIVRINGVTVLTGNLFSPDVGQAVDGYWERLSQQRPDLLRSGIADAFSVESPMLRQVLHMHPNMMHMEARELIWSLGEGAEGQLNQLVQEFDQLNEQLNAWAFTGGGASQRYVRYEQLQSNARHSDARYAAKTRIRDCWLKRTPEVFANDGTPIGQELDLSGLTLPTLPDLSADFSHVGSLKLNNMNLGVSPEGFLANFRGVRWLDLSGNQLRELPPALERMQGLTRLFLRNNQIRLTEQTAQVLASRSTLRALILNGNPLGVVPDFSALTQMRSLGLSDVGLDTWPTGLEGMVDLDGVNLVGNRLTEIPSSLIAPDDAQLAHSERITRVIYAQNNPFSDDSLQQVRTYATRIDNRSNLLVTTALQRGVQAQTRAAGAPFERWAQGFANDELTRRQTQWQTLREQRGADGFFRMLDDLQAGGADHDDLQRRVWEVIDRITRHTAEAEALREEMFEWAGRPACCDRAALSFSNIEVMAMVDKARAQATDQTQAGALIALSRGLFRLDEVEKIALGDIAKRTEAINARPGLSPAQQQEQIAQLEEVEIRLAYRFGLKGKDRLDLPGQPSQVRFTGLANVSPAMLDAAQARVLALNDSPQEFQALLSREFWQDFVTHKYRVRFEALSKPYHDQLAALHEQFEAKTLSADALDAQAKALQAQRAIEEAALIETLSRQELVGHSME